MNWKIPFFVILGLAGLLAFLYWGLNTAEKGIRELLAINGTPAQAFSYACQGKGIQIFFAGRAYSFDCPQILRFFSSLVFRRN